MTSIQDFSEDQTRAQISQLRKIFRFINSSENVSSQNKKQKFNDESTGVFKKKDLMDISDLTENQQAFVKSKKPKFHPTLRKALQQCKKLIDDLMKHEFSEPFVVPVDPIRLNIPDYLNVVKKPMDLGTVRKNLDDEVYLTIKEFSDDARLIWHNAMSYNHPKSGIYKMAQTLSIVFEEKFTKVLSIVDLTPAQRKKNLELKITNLQESIEQFKNDLKELRIIGLSSSLEQKHINPQKRQNVRNTEPMTFKEKSNLSDAINNLPPQYLSGIFSIIDEEIPNALKTGANEVELDIDSLDTYVLRRLESYIKTFPPNFVQE